MFTLKRTTSEDADFVHLVSFLDADLRRRDGEDHGFFAQFNKLDSIKHVVVGYEGDIPVACGAFKAFEGDTVEIKRMFVHEDKRGKGYAKAVLAELETWASSLDYANTILETGKKQPEAIALYLKSGYQIIPNYGQYKDVESSVCMTKGI